MPRVRTVPAEDVTGKVREVYDSAGTYGSFSSLVGVMANRPPVLEHIFGLLLDLKAEGVLPARYLELALVTVSKLNECTFCVSNHTPRLNASGISLTAADNILDYEIGRGFRRCRQAGDRVFDRRDERLSQGARRDDGAVASRISTTRRLSN